MIGCLFLLLFCFAGYGQAHAKEQVKAVPQEPSLTALSVSGTQLVDAEGKPVQLKGISTHGLAWFPEYVNEECFRQLKQEWGINVIRLALYPAEHGGYCTGGDKDSLKALVRKGVEYAEKCGLYVIIDWHILSDGNPNTYLQEAESFFDEMSQAYAGRTNVIYEICNEPNNGATWADVKGYAERILSVIRRNDPNSIVLVGTPNWCQSIEEAAANPIADFKNVMYTMHFYAATHKESLRQSMAEALEKGLPIFVSEFGICDASGSGEIDSEQAGEWLRLMDERGISYVAWNLSNKAETSAVLKSGCQKTSGFAAEDYSASGKWLIEAFGAPAIKKMPPVAADVLEIRQGLAVGVDLAAGWEENGKTYSKYGLQLKNQTVQAKNGWSVCLEFDRDVALVNGWNGIFQTDGNRLVISSMEYNKQIEGGGTLDGVGFILKTEGKASLVSP